MTNAEPTLNALKALMAQQPELMAQLQAATSLPELIALLAQAGSAAGMTVDAETLLAHLQTAGQQPLDDQQLEVVAGGMGTAPAASFGPYLSVKDFLDQIQI